MSTTHCAVLGSPIRHSLSPALHRAAYADLGLASWRYEALEVGESDLPGFIEDLDETWRGLSLTMPLKQAIFPLLDDVSETATAVGAVNTVVLDWNDGQRVLRGYNTDVQGIIDALREAEVHAHGGAHDLSRHACLLGAGATAGSALAALARLGMSQVDVVARRPEAAQHVADLGAQLGVNVLVRPWEEAVASLAAAHVVISTVPAGAADGVAAELERHDGRVEGALLDVVYSPWPTRLAQAGADRGERVVSGHAMLLHQAVAQVKLMTGRDPDVEVMRAALPAG